MHFRCTGTTPGDRFERILRPLNIPSGGHAVPDDDRGEPVVVPLIWGDTDRAPVLFANQFMLQRVPDGFILGVGQVTPPILLGEQVDREAQLRQLVHVAVTVLGRYSMSRDRAVELRDLLSTQISKFDEGNLAMESPASGS